MSTTTRLQHRLRPLHIAAFFQGVMLWVPVEKLFMDEIGFDPASVGVMAAAYAAVVPVLEIPSGILADRWSRRGVLMIANVALTASALIGGLSSNVGTYIIAALALGVFLAMQSGTVDSIVYDTVLEETGSSDDYERQLGRLRLIESVALVSSALAGGLVATVASPRLAYFLTIPWVIFGLRSLAGFREPRLHQAADPVPLRAQVALTYRTLLRRGHILPVVTLMVLTSVLLQAVLEFGPLWLVALATPAYLFGPAWAGLMASFGLGGSLAGRVRLERPATMGAVVVALVACSVAQAVSHAAIVVIATQVVLAVLVVAVGIFLSRRLHDSIPSTIRSGVASGIGTFTWIAFVPFSVAFGRVSNGAGVHTAGWMLVATAAVAGALLLKLALGEQAAVTTDVDGADVVVSGDVGLELEPAAA